MTRKRILLVDDDPITNLINTKLITRDFNHSVTAYTNAQEALAYLQEMAQSSPAQMPETIFLDINMPIMDGWEFLEAFQHLPQTLVSKCRVYILSSSIDTLDIERSQTISIVKDFISKPLTPETIRALLTPEHKS